MSKQKILEAYRDITEGINEANRTLEGNWKGFASRYERSLTDLEDAIELIRDDKVWYKKLDRLLNQLDQLGVQMNKEMDKR